MRVGLIRRVIGAAAVVTMLGAANAAAGHAGEAKPATATASYADDPATQLIVRYRPGTSPADRAAAEAGAHTTLHATIDALGVRVLKAASAADRSRALAALQHNPHVDYAEPDAVAHAAAVAPNDPYWSKQWGTTKTMTDTAWSTTTGSSTVVIAELDTGVDAGHADLSGAFTAGYDFINNDSNPADDYGHGTEVAGVLAARGNNNVGIAGQCWSCRIMPVKVLNSSGSGSYSAISNGITYAADHGARIINMSLGGTVASSTLQNAVNYAWNKGVLLIAAAGNAGTTAYNYPGAYDPVVAVAGSDSRDARYSWSTYGSWVEVAAPGCDQTTTMGGGYAVPCGTSFASPMTAGIAGLLASANPGATNAALRSALINTTDPVGSYVAYGRVNAAKAMAAVGTGSSPSPSPSPSTTTNTFSSTLSKQQPTRTFAVAAGAGAFSASLSFSRAASLTLTVKAPDGTVIASPTGPSVLKLSGSFATAGTYTFTVSGADRATFDLSVTHS